MTRQKIDIEREISALNVKLAKGTAKHQERMDRKAELLRELKAFDLPPEPGDKSNIFRMVMVFPGNTKKYTYAVVRAGDAWFTTGTGVEKRFSSWRQLVEWVRREATSGYNIWLTPLFSATEKASFNDALGNPTPRLAGATLLSKN